MGERLQTAAIAAQHFPPDTTRTPVRPLQIRGLASGLMVSVALVVKLVAKPGVEEELAGFLEGALELANAEEGTPVWMALRSDPSTFWIVDAFPGADERQAHLEGEIANALFANADRLLAEAPEVNVAEVLAFK
jgi:quinol monooxygenase YgiN